MKKLIPIIILISMLSGCAAVPDEVKDDMSSYHNEERKDFEDIGFTYVNISELAETSEAALNKEYTQFKISDNITLNKLEEIYLMSFEKVNLTDNISEYFYNAMNLFFTSSEINEQQVQRPVYDTGDCIMFDDTEKKVYGNVGDDGFIAMLKPDAFDISYAYNQPNVKIYHIDRKDDLSDEYQLNDGKCSVEDAVKYVNNWLDVEYRKFSPEYDYKVETVIVREYEGDYLYQISVQAFYKGVPLDSYTSEMEMKNGEFTGKMQYSAYGIQIQMLKVNEISSFTTGRGILIPKEKEKIEECISLESALDYCKNIFTDFKNITISDIDIMYTINPVYKEIQTEVSEPNGNNLTKYVVVGYDSRPVWAFIIDVQPEDFLANGEINTYGDMRKYVYIDMITGELHYNFDIVYCRR